MSIDPIFATVVIAALVSIVALVAITHRQKDVAALAIRALGRLPDDKSPSEQAKKLQAQSENERDPS